MKSASYTINECPKCSSNRYREGITIPPDRYSTRVRDWVQNGYLNSNDWLGRHSGCIGCTNVGIEPFLVLGLLLEKLSIRV